MLLRRFSMTSSRNVETSDTLRSKDDDKDEFYMEVMDNTRMTTRILVACNWLRETLLKTAVSDLKILESTWVPKGKGIASFLTEHIPKARFFDMWENVTYSTPYISRPLPDLKLFEKQLERAGISDSDHVVLYDKGPLMFSARMYLQCKHIGLQNVSVLDGGFKHWKYLGYETETGEAPPVQPGQYNGKHKPRFDDLATISGVARGGSKQIVDTRAPDFFCGENEEPSPGTQGALKAAGITPPKPGTMLGGHHIGARNVFYETLRDQDTGCFKSKDELTKLFAQAGVDIYKPTVGTCYNALTACMLPLAAEKCGASPDNFNVYIGSWTEYGQRGAEQDIEIGESKLVRLSN